MKTQRTYINDKDRDQKLIIILQQMNNHMKPSRSGSAFQYISKEAVKHFLCIHSGVPKCYFKVMKLVLKKWQK